MNIDALVGRVCRVGMKKPPGGKPEMAWDGEGVCIGGAVILDQLYVLIEFNDGTSEWPGMAKIEQFMFKEVAWMPKSEDDG